MKSIFASGHMRHPSLLLSFADIKNMLKIYVISYRDFIHILFLVCILIIMAYLAIAPFIRHAGSW